MNRTTKMIGIAMLACICALTFPGAAAFADEGMWTYDHPPLKLLEERYGFKATPEFLDHLRLSSVNAGASASFVSEDGLILTNHHVALGSLQRLSTPEHNYVRDGFYAKSPAEELPVPGMSVRVLVAMEDVTAKVEGAVKAGATPAQAREQRQAAITALEAECAKSRGLQGQVVTLYGGARYSLYAYREYTDVRIVFAPELQAAFFGGDYDNFTYPRYDFDVALLRAYEKGQPAKVKDFLKVNPEGAKDGDLIFVSGHPGRTERLLTFAGLVYARDLDYPFSLARIKHSMDVLNEYSAKGPEQARRARTWLYFMANSYKAREGEFRGLEDKALMAKKAASDGNLRQAVAADPKLEAQYGSAWTEAEGAYAWAKEHQNDIRYKMTFGGRGMGGVMTVLRYPAEMAKPDADRLEGFHDAEIESTLRRVTAPGPYYKDMEEVLLADELNTLLKALGPEDPFVKALLQGQTPEAAAHKAIEGTQIGDAAFRRQLLENKGKAVADCKDPLLDMVRRVEPTLRENQKLYRDKFGAVLEDAHTKLAKARFAVYGESAYPDATGTLRLAFGKVAGYPFATTLVPPFTTFYGLYDRAYSFGDTGDFALTKSQEAHRADLNLATPLNNVTTADITGGNSGSPLVDKEGRLVGLVFDGNMESHPNVFVYDETEARCVAVDIRGLLEGLRKLYGAGGLADEMVNGKR
jgi:hypothetical protein